MKKTRQHTYSLMAAMVASPDMPMPEFMRVHKLTRVRGGLLAIMKGNEPKADDWRVIVDAVNLMDTLVLQGKIEDAGGTLTAATNALDDAARRALHGKGIRLDAKGIEVLRGVLDDYELVLESLSHREMMYCHRATEKRMWEVLDKAKCPDGVSVTCI
jgi:hypothetical protein